MINRKMLGIVVCAFALAGVNLSAADPPPTYRSCRSGLWSDPKVWDRGSVPTAGARVQVQSGHTIIYDLDSDRAIRFVHVAGVLSFAPTGTLDSMSDCSRSSRARRPVKMALTAMRT